jgi:hypothetical protein
MEADQQDLEISHGFSEDLLGGSGCVSQHRHSYCPDMSLDTGNHMLSQKVLINVSIDLFASANEKDCCPPPLGLFTSKQTFRFRRDDDAGVHIDHREVCQVVVVLALMAISPLNIFSPEKKSGSDEAGWLQLVEEFLAPLLPHFLGVWG